MLLIMIPANTESLSNNNFNNTVYYNHSIRYQEGKK